MLGTWPTQDGGDGEIRVLHSCCRKNKIQDEFNIYVERRDRKGLFTFTLHSSSDPLRRVVSPTAARRSTGRNSPQRDFGTRRSLAKSKLLAVVPLIGFRSSWPSKPGIPSACVAAPKNGCMLWHKGRVCVDISVALLQHRRNLQQDYSPMALAPHPYIRSNELHFSSTPVLVSHVDGTEKCRYCRVSIYTHTLIP
jgi:hypothetical protein